MAFGGEVFRGEPGLEAGAEGGPFGVGDGEPGGVSVLAFHHHVVAEGAFVGEAEALGGAAGGGVGGVAAPLTAAVAQGGHGVVGQEEEGLCGDAGSGDFGTPQNMADFGGAVGGDDVHQGLAAFDAVGGAVDDGEEHRIGAGGFGDEPRVEIGAGGGDGVGEVAVEAFGLGAGDGFEELVAVASGVEGFEAAILAFEDLGLGGGIGGLEGHGDLVGARRDDGVAVEVQDRADWVGLGWSAGVRGLAGGGGGRGFRRRFAGGDPGWPGGGGGDGRV